MKYIEATLRLDFIVILFSILFGKVRQNLSRESNIFICKKYHTYVIA